MRILLTGGAGFVGINFTRYLLERYPTYTLISLAPLRSDRTERYVRLFSGVDGFQHVDARLEDESALQGLFAQGVDVVVNMAARTHVDQSLRDPASFVQANVAGPQRLLHLASQHTVKRFVQVSSAEVYGAAGAGEPIGESAPLEPANPYAATKASSDLLALAYHRALGLDVVVTRCTNNYGPYQRADKLVPLVIANALRGRPIPMYGDGNQARDWLHVADHCTALDAIIHRGTAGSVYNIASHRLATTREIIQTVLSRLDRPWSLVQAVPDRSGNNHRQSLDCTRLVSELRWEPAVNLLDGLRDTIAWYAHNSEWWENR